MIAEEIPGFGVVQLDHVVLDMNGTLTVAGELIPGVAERLQALAGTVSVHVVTADTYGVAERVLSGLPVTLTVLRGPGEAEAKEAYVVNLGADRCAAMGNGRNDVLMLRRARVGIAVVEGEGCAAEAAAAADVLTRSILEALDLLLHPVRLRATLRR